MITRTYQRADAFLFGRRTYELFAGSWGAIEEMRAHPIGVALNETPKYVASTTLTGPRWADTTVLSGDLVVAMGDAVRGVQKEFQFRNLSGDPGKGLAVDGIFGPDTDAAVRGFQQALHLDIASVTVDGIVGPITWQALVSGMLSF